MMSIYSCFDVNICKTVSRVVKLLCIYVWIEAHACETSNVIKKKITAHICKSQFALVEHTVCICNDFETNVSKT